MRGVFQADKEGYARRNGSRATRTGTHDVENCGRSAFDVFVPGHHFEVRFAAWAS